MKIGIVGHEAAKFTPETEALARQFINKILRPGDVVVSGACHLGGVDRYAEEEAAKLALDTIIHAPAKLRWSGGYKERNIKIAEDSDEVFSIVVKEYPPDYKGMRFKLCYHCKTDTHIKSGGCWTARYAGRLGKPFHILEI